MSEQVNIHFDKADVARLMEQMRRAQVALGRSVQHSVNMAAKSIVNSLAQSTAIAPKYRDIAELPSPKRKGRASRKLYEVNGWFGKPRKRGTRRVLASNISEVKHTVAKISNRGLARRTWTLAGKSIRSSLSEAMGGAADSISNISLSSKAGRYVEVETSMSGMDSYIVIRNWLPYMTDAIQGGPQKVETVMQRAADAMEKSITKQLVKDFGVK